MRCKLAKSRDAGFYPLILPTSNFQLTTGVAKQWTNPTPDLFEVRWDGGEWRDWLGSVTGSATISRPAIADKHALQRRERFRIDVNCVPLRRVGVRLPW